MSSIEFSLRLDTPLHIGNGQTPGAFARDTRGRPCIPATTLKGLHRVSVEVLVAQMGLPERMCYPVAGQAGKTACPVCLIFGSPWLAGKVYYRDTVSNAQSMLDSRVTMPQSRRRQVGIGRFTTTREVLPAGITFAGRIDHQLTDQALLALALAGLRAIIHIGGGAALGYGLCRIEARALNDTRLPVSESDLTDALRAFRQRS